MSSALVFIAFVIGTGVLITQCNAKKEDPTKFVPVKPTIDAVCYENVVLVRSETGWLYKKDDFGNKIAC